MTRRLRPAHALFFPAAALHAALLVPLSLHAMTGAGWLPVLGTGLAHGHEMLFGFALAVVAGYLLGQQPRVRLYALLALWLAARLAFALGAPLLLSGLANAGFAVALAALVAPKFLSAAKKLRNQAFAPVLIAISLSAVGFQLATGRLWLQRTLLVEAVLLFSLLMLFMGGRVIAPAAAGALQRRGLLLEARVQPRIEGALILSMAAAVLLLLVPGAGVPTALALLAAAALTLVRLVRWRLWQSRRADLICLGLGYAWLGVGLAAVGAALLGHGALTAALHLLTVGALGTLTTGVMARIRLTRAKHDPSQSLELIVIALLISAATLLRAGGGLWLPIEAWWWGAGAWSAAFLLLFRLLLRVPAR